MSTRQIHVFISHSWSYDAHYQTLAAWIFGKNWSVGQASLDLRDYSVPKDDPIHNARNAEALRNAIYDKIQRSHVVVIPTAVYASYSDWIGKEIAGAKHYGKPILAVDPRGQERKSSIVADNASQHVGWTEKSVIDGIWSLYQNG